MFDITPEVNSINAKAQSAINQAAIDSQPSPGFSDLQMHGDWQLHIGTNIGPIDPKAIYGMTQFQAIAGRPYAMKLSLQGVRGTWSDVLWALKRIPPTSFVNVKFSGELLTDANTPNGAQAIETDTIIALGGMLNNLSSQINDSEGGMLQVTKANRWTDTGIVLGKLAPNLWHPWTWEYAIDRVNKTFSHVAYTLDGVRHVIPMALQNQAAIATTWPDGIHPQLQIDANSQGIGFYVAHNALNYSFS